MTWLAPFPITTSKNSAREFLMQQIPNEGKTSVVPAEAVDAAMTAAVNYYREVSPNLAASLDDNTSLFRIALEAAAPQTLSPERADELAAEYRRGYRDGLTDRKQVTASPQEWQPGDPIE